MGDVSEGHSPVNTEPDPSYEHPEGWPPLSPNSQVFIDMQAAQNGPDLQQEMELPSFPGSAATPAAPAVATAAITPATQLAVPAPEAVAVAPEQLTAPAATGAEETAPAAQTAAAPPDPPTAGVTAAIPGAIAPAGAGAAVAPPAPALPPPPAVAITAGLISVPTFLPQQQPMIPPGFVAIGFIGFGPQQPQQQGPGLPGISAGNVAVATAQPPVAGAPLSAAAGAPPQLIALLQQQIAGYNVDPAALAAAAGSSYVPAPAGAAPAAAAAPSAAENQNPLTAAGAGAQGPSTASWTLQHYWEQQEHDRLLRQQQDIRSSGPTEEAGTSPAAAPAAAEAPAAAAPAAPASGKAKKRKKNVRLNMRNECRQAEQASASSSAAAAAAAGAGEGSSGQRATGGKAGRKGGSSLIHHRMKLLRRIKALLGWRGWLLWNTVVAAIGDRAGNLNDAGVSAFFHTLFGPYGDRWPQDEELTHQAVEDNLFLARLLSSMIGSFIHPSEVAGFFKQKRKGKTEAKQSYLASRGLYPDEWTWPLQEGPPAQPAAQQTADQQSQDPQEIAGDIHAVGDAAVAALHNYDAEAAALLQAGLQRLRHDETESGKVLKSTGTKRRRALEKKIIAAARQRGNPAAAAAAAAAEPEPQAARGAGAASQQLLAAAASTRPRTRQSHSRRARQGGVNQGGAAAATYTAGAAAAAAPTAAEEDVQSGQTGVIALGTALEQGGSDEADEEEVEVAPAGPRRSNRRKETPRRYRD